MKKLLALIAASIATSLLLYALVSRDQPARHPALKATGLEPLIALHDLYGASHDNEDEMTTGTAINLASGERTAVVLGGLAAQLTFPETDSDPGPLPTVILVNGGEAAGTSPDTRRMVRFLTNRGYLVLSIDCGNPAELDKILFENAPGLSIGCSESDITDRVRTLVDRRIADPDALAIIGSGTGGYLALMTMSLERGLFKAAIVHSLASDQTDRFIPNTFAMKPDQAVTGPYPHAFGTHKLSLADWSPTSPVGNVPARILISHGKADSVVGSDQAKAFAQRLSDAGMNIEFISFNHEDHRYSRWQTNVQVARLTERFLARHLGGRDGGYDYIELLAKVF